MGVDRKRKNELKIFARGPLISNLNKINLVGLVAKLADGWKIKKCFFSLKYFSGKPDSVILVGFECPITPQNVIKIVGTSFEKMKI